MIYNAGPNVRIIVLTPSSTPQRVIFPYDKNAKKFITSSYTPLQTQNRLYVEEVEQFLEEANKPLLEWYEEFGTPPKTFYCLLVLSLILFPLFFVLLCWMAPYSKRSHQKLQECVDKSKLFIRDNNHQFVQRGLMWNAPVHYPQWIELWTEVNAPQSQPQGFPMMSQGQPGYVGFSRPGISTQVVPQQNYQNQQGYYA